MRLATTLFIAVGAAACGGVQALGDGIPSIEAVDPAIGPQGGGTTVTLSGSALDFGEDTPTRVAVGTTVVEATVVDDQTITFTTPPGLEGPADVVVFHGGGATVAPGAFTYTSLPGVNSIEPVLAGEGQTVTIRGFGFQADGAGTVSVEIDGAALTDVQVQSNGVLTAVLPAAPNEPFVLVDVVVTTGNGPATLPNSFRYARSGLVAVANRQSGRGLYFVDPTTAELTFLGKSATPVTRLTVAANGQVFALSGAIDSGVGLLGELTFDDEPRVINQINLSIAPRGGDLAIDGDIFALDRLANNGTLRRYNNSGTQVAEVVAQILPRSTQPTCIFRNNATTLFAIQRLDGPLSTLDKASGALVTVGTLNGPADFGCHGATRIGNEVFVVGFNVLTRGTTNESKLFKLDTGTAMLTEVGDLAENGVGIRIKSVGPTPPNFGL